MAESQDSNDLMSRLLCKTIVEQEPSFFQIWNRLGLSESQINQRCTDMNAYLKEMFESMIEEEQENERKIIAIIERLCKEEFMICKELGEEPLSFNENDGLLAIEKRHRAYIETLQARKDEIMVEVRELIAEDEMLCERLEIQPFTIAKNKIPSTSTKAALKDHIQQVKGETRLRMEEFKKIEKELRTLFTELELSPRNAMEAEIFSADINTVKLGSSKMQAMKDLRDEMASRVNQNKQKFSQLTQQIAALWARLNIEQSHQAKILRENPNHAPSCIANLTEELHRCEELKRQNIKLFIDKVRTELVVLWDKCFVGQVEREDFVPFHSNLLTDDILALLEMEVDKYKEFYETNRDIFNKIEKRDQLWNKMRDLDAISKDPTRLFANRGCKLLQEEKERKRINQELPRIEGELVHLLNQYESRNGQPLKFHGEDFRGVIERQWEEFQMEKENEKQKKLKEKQEKQQEERKAGAKPLTPLKRRIGLATVGMSTARVDTASPKAKRKCPTTQGSAMPVVRYNARTNARVDVAGAASSDPNDTVGTTYSVFTAGIERKSEKEDCRSSLNGSPVHNLPSHMKSAKTHMRRSKSNPNLLGSPRHTPGNSVRTPIPRNLRPFL